MSDWMPDSLSWFVQKSVICIDINWMALLVYMSVYFDDELNQAKSLNIQLLGQTPFLS